MLHILILSLTFLFINNLDRIAPAKQLTPPVGPYISHPDPRPHVPVRRG